MGAGSDNDLGNSQSSPLLSKESSAGRSRQSESEAENSKFFGNHHVSFRLDDYHINPVSVAVGPNVVTVENFSKPTLLNSERSRISAHHAESVNDGIEKYTKRQLLIFLVYTFSQFFLGISVSLQAPFYPAEAEKKGVTASQYGAVFGIFEFTVFAVSFIYGKYMSSVGPKFAYNIGLFATGVCAIFFGLLDQIQDGTTFFALSMVTRILEAMGTGASVNAAFVIIAMEFPKSVATTFATMETIFGVGLTCGPIIGGALFQLGGFSLPFVSTGVLMILTAVFVFVVLPSPVDTNEEADNKKGLFHIIKIPKIVIGAFCIFVNAISIGHLEATLEPHIRNFELSSIEVGLVIVISGATYAICAPLWGWLCDRKPTLDLYMLIGSFFNIIGFLLIGPAPFIPIQTILWVTCVGMVFHGIGIGACLVASFIQCLSVASSHGYPDNVSTYSLISGLWASFFSLGNFIGPTVAGILYDMVGFRNGTLFVIGLHSVLVMAIIFVMICGQAPAPGAKRRLSEFTESDPLLGSSKSFDKKG